jgi:general stress protein 26
MTDKKVLAAEAFVQSVRTGERIASKNLEPHLADDVVLDTGREQVSGKASVLERVSGVWPSTSIYYQGGWTDPAVDGDKLKVNATFPALGAAPAGMNLTFSFNGQGQISHVQQENVTGGPPQTVEEIPQHVKGQIDGALANGTPLAVVYVDESGQPQQSLRGSTIVYSPTQLAIWLRNAEGGLTKALASNDRVSLLYRDSKTRSTVVFQGRAHIAGDEETRSKVYEKTPEVEQFHDTGRKGAALIIDVTRMQAGGPKGNYRMTRE